jgi:hypothetical protein
MYPYNIRQSILWHADIISSSFPWIYFVVCHSVLGIYHIYSITRYFSHSCHKLNAGYTLRISCSDGMAQFVAHLQPTLADMHQHHPVASQNPVLHTTLNFTNIAQRWILACKCNSCHVYFNPKPFSTATAGHCSNYHELFSNQCTDGCIRVSGIFHYLFTYFPISFIVAFRKPF